MLRRIRAWNMGTAWKWVIKNLCHVELEWGSVDLPHFYLTIYPLSHFVFFFVGKGEKRVLRRGWDLALRFFFSFFFVWKHFGKSGLWVTLNVMEGFFNQRVLCVCVILFCWRIEEGINIRSDEIYLIVVLLQSWSWPWLSTISKPSFSKSHLLIFLSLHPLITPDHNPPFQSQN